MNSTTSSTDSSPHAARKMDRSDALAELVEQGGDPALAEQYLDAADKAFAAVDDLSPEARKRLVQRSAQVTMTAANDIARFIQEGDLPQAGSVLGAINTMTALAGYATEVDLPDEEPADLDAMDAAIDEIFMQIPALMRKAALVSHPHLANVQSRTSGSPSTGNYL